MQDRVDRTPHPQLLNRHAYSMVNDPHLSFRAKGLWFYMLLKPDGWDFAATRITNDTKEGVSAIYAGLKELKHLGYLTSRKLKSGREVYKLYTGRDAPKSPFLGDYDFEPSGEFVPWIDDCWSTRDSRPPDASCTIEDLANHLIFILSLEEWQAWQEAEEWAKACSEAGLALLWRNADIWAKRISYKYPQSHTAKTAAISK